jgi:uncharacterized protein involved in outer membrane biogenesis
VNETADAKVKYAATTIDRSDRPVNTARPLRHILRWTLWIGLGFIVLLIAVGGAFFAFADRYDLAPLVAGRLTASLERKVIVGSLHVTPGRWLHVELRDFQLDNLPGGTQSIMTTVSSASAEIEAMSLLRGPVVVRGLTVNGLNVLLERTSDGRKNWKFSAAAQSAAPKPSDRTRFPILLDAQITGDVVFRTSSGHPLDTRLNQSQLHTEAADRPLRLAGSGSYNGTPVKLEADLGSLDTLRDAAIPYPTEIYVTSGDTTLHFQGTMTEPLDVDGAKGRIELIAPTALAILQIAGASDDFGAALRLVGQFEHHGTLWHLSEASGALNEDTITAANVTLVEGPHGKPDDLSVDLAFEHLDVNVLLAAKKKGPIAEADVPLTVDLAPDTLIAAKVSARELAYAGVRASDVTFGGSLKPGRITIDVLSLGYFGSLFRASGQIEAMAGPSHADSGRVTANVDMTRMDVQVLRKLLAAGDVPLLGRIDGRALVDATGATLNQAARGARLSAVVAMESGSISRRIIELASTDARAMFRKATGMSPISCLVGVLDIRGGIGTLSPLRIRSADGTITGRGSFDIYRHQINITVASEARTTSLFALDVPVHVSGSFASPTIRPATLSAAGRAQLSADDDVSQLLPSLQPFARRSPCLSARAG